MSDDPILIAVAELRAAFLTELAKRSTEIMDRVTAIAGDVRNLRSEHSVTRDLVAALPATVLSAIEKPLLNRMTGLEDRVTRIESP